MLDKIHLNKLIKDTDNLAKYINFIKVVYNLSISLKDDSVPSIMEFIHLTEEISLEKKLFEYKAIIISLYGILEYTVEKWFQETVTQLSTTVTEYSELTIETQNNHLKKSLQLIEILMDGSRPKFEHLNIQDILNKLYTCTINNSTTINHEAYLTSGNYSHKKIIDLFRTIDIVFMQINRIDFTNEFEQLGLNINNLLSRRNEVAHGVESIEILNNEYLHGLILNLQKYFTLLFKNLNLCILYKKLYKTHKKFTIIKTFMNKSVLSLIINDLKIKEGQYIYISNTNKYDLIQAKIVEIRIKIKLTDEIKNRKKITAKNNTEISIKLDKADLSISQNSTIYFPISIE